MPRPPEARSCLVTFVLPLPVRWATSHEPLAGSRRCPSRPGLHLGARTRSRRLVVSSPLPAVARFCRARPLTARAASSVHRCLFLRYGLNGGYEMAAFLQDEERPLLCIATD